MKKILYSIMMLAIAGNMLAVPAYPGWQTKTQPDGTTITIRQNGDEFYHFWENEQGQLVEENEQGYWQVVGETSTPATVASRRAETRMNRQKLAAMAAQADNNGPHKVGEQNLAPRGLVILVNFADQKYLTTNTQTAMNDMLNGDNYTYNGAMGSARKYFSDQSNGQYVPTFDVVGPVTVKNNYAFYGRNVDGDGDDAYVIDMVVEACKEADKLGVDFTKYNNDGDYFVDFIYIIYAGKGEADGGNANTIWPHNFSAYAATYWTEKEPQNYDFTHYKTDDLIFDGLYIDNYACSGEINGQTNKRNGIGVICHEFGHVLGLPDFYDTEYGTNYKKNYIPGNWDVMAGGSYNGSQNCPPNYSAWEKYFFGWATPTCLSEKGNYTLTTNYGESYQINAKGTQANWDNTNLQYYLENRQKTGWDTYLPGHGMLVWKVLYDKEAWDKNAPNNEANNPRYVVMSASGNKSMQGAADPFPGTQNVTSFNTFSQYPVKNIKENNKVITFTFIDDAPMERWSEWADFAPKGCATGNYTFNVAFESGTDTQTQIPVKIRTNLDDIIQHEIKMCNWGKDVFSDNGVDIIINWNEQTNACKVATQATGYVYTEYGDLYVGDISAWQQEDYSTSYPCTYDPETCTFTLSLAYFLSGGYYIGYTGDEDGKTTETLQMDIEQPTAIQEVAAPKHAVKMLYNGQLLIHYEGKTYNVLGAKWNDK